MSYTKDSILKFGKHSGKTLEYILNIDPGYIIWLHEYALEVMPYEMYISAKEAVIIPDYEQ